MISSGKGYPNKLDTIWTSNQKSVVVTLLHAELEPAVSDRG